jgi:hypothetical protein
MKRKNILFICGSMNQTTMMVSIAKSLQQHHCYFTPYYSEGFLDALARSGLLNFTILAGHAKQQSLTLLNRENVPIDERARNREYDLVVTCSDLIIPKNIKGKKIILVQEGMTDPENLKYYLVKNLRLPLYLANTSTTGLSDAYVKFCVASEGYKELFARKGIKEEKIAVTGIPNFDNVIGYQKNDFPFQGYVLAATSHLRECLKYENRKKFIKKVVGLADGRECIFKLHPGEDHQRAFLEINKYAPKALVYLKGNTNHMVANCDIFVTRYSSVLLIALAMGKKVYSDLDPQLLKKIVPIQNGGQSAQNIATLCENYL